MDVSHLELGKAIHLGEIKLPEGVEIFGDKNIPVIAVALPRTEEEEAAATEAAPAAAGDVEMIKEKKEEGEEGAAAGQGRRRPPPRAPKKAPAKGAEKGRPLPAAKGRRQGRREKTGGEKEIILPAAPAEGALRPVARAWRMCISSWAWAIRARNTRRRATTPVSCWSRNWRRAGRRTGRTNASSARASPARTQDGKRVLLCQPQTFMNLSGEAVGALMNFYQLPLKRLLVAVDDADLPLGEIRLRASGSSGGHHGLESIEQHLGTREFARLRIGIGRADGAREITDYVLARFDAAESGVDGKSFGPGGRPGGMLAGRRN